MDELGYEALNGFTQNKRRNGGSEDIENDSSFKDAYASAYTTADTELIVALPGQRLTIPFNNTALIKNMVHDADTLEACDDGDYRIDFILFLYSEVSAVLSFIILVNDEPVPGGTFSCTLDRGHQVCTASTMSGLSEGDTIRVIYTAPSALSIILINSTLSVVKLD